MKGCIKGRLAALILAAAFLLTGAAAQAQISIVIGKASAYTPSEADIKAYLSGVKLQWPDGAKVVVADQTEAAIAKTVYEKFLGSSLAQVRKEWTKLVLSGQAAAPVKCASDAEVIKAVAANPAAIGFISRASLDATVKEVAKIE